MKFLLGLLLGWFTPRCIQAVKDELEERRIEAGVRRSNVAWGIPADRHTRKDKAV